MPVTCFIWAVVVHSSQIFHELPRAFILESFFGYQIEHGYTISNIFFIFFFILAIILLLWKKKTWKIIFKKKINYYADELQDPTSNIKEIRTILKKNSAPMMDLQIVGSGNPTSFNTEEVVLTSVKMSYVWGWDQQYQNILLRSLLSPVLADSNPSNLTCMWLFVGDVKSNYSLKYFLKKRQSGICPAPCALCHCTSPLPPLQYICKGLH